MTVQNTMFAWPQGTPKGLKSTAVTPRHSITAHPNVPSVHDLPQDQRFGLSVSNTTQRVGVFTIMTLLLSIAFREFFPAFQLVGQQIPPLAGGKGISVSTGAGDDTALSNQSSAYIFSGNRGQLTVHWNPGERDEEGLRQARHHVTEAITQAVGVVEAAEQQGTSPVTLGNKKAFAQAVYAQLLQQGKEDDALPTFLGYGYQEQVQ